MSSVSRYSDEHTLYIISGAARSEDLKCSVMRCLKKFERKTKKRYSCTVIANLIYNQEGVPYGFGYLYVSNPKVYHMLLGRNPDGSERSSIIDCTMKLFSPLEKEGDWLDWVKESENIQIKQNPPLIILPSFYYKPNQTILLEKMLENMRSSESQRINTDQFDNKCCTFIVHPGLVKPIQSKYSTHVLCARDIPRWLQRMDVYNKFRPFVHNKEKKLKGNPYPLISINNKNKLCFVEFDPLSRDAQFALIMTTKVLFQRQRSSEKKVLIFTHSFKSHKKPRRQK